MLPVKLFIICDPVVAFAPDHPSEAVQAVAFVDSQESVNGFPATTFTVPVLLFALKVTCTTPPPDDDEEEEEELLDDELMQFCVVAGFWLVVPQLFMSVQVLVCKLPMQDPQIPQVQLGWQSDVLVLF